MDRIRDIGLRVQSAPATHAEDSVAELVVSLFDQLRSPLLRYLHTLGLDLSDGEEVVQEVFLLLVQHLRRNKSRSNLRGWLFRVAHNLALKRRYKNRRSCGATAPPAVDPALSPEERLIQDQAHGQVLAVIDALPEQDRKCLALRAEGLRYREVAEILGISLGSVSMSLARSLGRIARSSHR